MMNTTVCVCVPDRWVRIWKIMWQISFEPTVTGSLLPISETSDTTRTEIFQKFPTECEGDTGILEIMRAYHDCGYTGYVRPDHGRHLWGEEAHCRPGYGLYDRALGIMYLWGCWDMLERLDGKI